MAGLPSVAGSEPVVYHLGQHFVQLTRDDVCLPVEVDPSFWEHGLDALPPGRLVSLIESDCDWPSWERHPNGEELIVQLSGELVLIFEIDGATIERRLTGGDFTIVPRGIWHTADVPQVGKALFITPGDGTEGRPRS
ncbi:MAG: cupin domain-containing protein [Sphingomicrobium sp.]